MNRVLLLITFNVAMFGSQRCTHNYFAPSQLFAAMENDQEILSTPASPENPFDKGFEGARTPDYWYPPYLEDPGTPPVLGDSQPEEDTQHETPDARPASTDRYLAKIKKATKRILRSAYKSREISRRTYKKLRKMATSYCLANSIRRKSEIERHARYLLREHERAKRRDRSPRRDRRRY